ncbi:MAG: hypothetical protein EPN39_01210 [Chitinophagaceae bacterium]|nr:MAG: hypothetical protein EPN39_01210 [Chitinophagaceae bacterium]
MKSLILLTLWGILLVACHKENQGVKNVYEVKQHAAWNAEKFKDGYTIQFPSGFTGGVTGFEGNIFYKSNTNDSVYFSYAFCSPTFCYDFGDTLKNTTETSIQGIFNFGKDTVSLAQRMNFTKNNQIEGIYFYDKEPFSHGKLYWKDGGVYKEALNAQYKKEHQQSVIEIMGTIQKK